MLLLPSSRRAGALLLAILSLAPCASAVSLDMTLLSSSNNIQSFFLADLNISGQAPSAQVFRVTVVFDQPRTEVFFRFLMNNDQVPIAFGRSNSFPLEMETVTLTNLDLTGPNNPYSLVDYEISTESEEIQNRMLETGYLPSGNYVITMELWESTGTTLLASDQIIATITNPFITQIITPNGTPSTPALLTASYPLFVWSSQAGQFLLKLCERLTPDQDPESVMQGLPNYQTDPSQPLTSLSFLYPTGGVKPLEFGHTYFWQITALVQTSSGLREYPSSIAAFTLIEASSNFQNQRIIAAIQMILGSGNQEPLDELSGFSPNGDIRLDGMQITIEELESLARKFSQGKCQTQTVRTE